MTARPNQFDIKSILSAAGTAIRMLDEALRSCGRCGRFWGRTDLYCQSCWQRLEMQAELSSPALFAPLGLRAHRLWNWSPGKCGDIGHLIYSLKGGGLPGAFARLAEMMTGQLLLCEEGFGDRSVVFIPAPPKQVGALDHAFELASALAELWQAPLWPGLARTEGEMAQKHRNRSHRQRAKMTLAPGFSRSSLRQLGPQQIVFVDDLITTGSTALAAREALGINLPFCAWALAERSRLPL